MRLLIAETVNTLGPDLKAVAFGAAKLTTKFSILVGYNLLSGSPSAILSLMLDNVVDMEARSLANRNTRHHYTSVSYLYRFILKTIIWAVQFTRD